MEAVTKRCSGKIRAQVRQRSNGTARPASCRCIFGTGGVGADRYTVPHSWDSICQLETEHSTTTQRYISVPFTRFAEGPCNLKSSGLVVRRRRRHARRDHQRLLK